MAGARGSARRELVARLFGSRNRWRGPGARVAWVRPTAALAVAAVLALGLGGLAWPRLREAVRRHPYFAVTEVVVRDPHRLGADEVRQAAGLAPGMSVWDVDPRAAEARLRAHPWIRSARVRRDLPRRVTIQVREERPVAIVVMERENAGDYFVSARGRVFARVAPGDARDLPYVTGLRSRDLADGDAVGARALRRAIMLLRRSGGLRVSEVHVDGVRGLTLMPVHPAIPLELGWHGFEEKLARLPRVMTLWAGREADIASVSLLFDDEVIVRTRVAPGRRAA